MPYNLLMAPAQIARCNRALPASKHLSTTRITHAWGNHVSQHDAVVLSADGIREVIAALRANPEPGDTYADRDLNHLDTNDLNLAHMDDTLASVLLDPEDGNMLFGVCL